MKRFLALAVLLTLLLMGCASVPYSPPPSPYTPADFSFAGETISFTGGGAVLGIDVSSHQGEIDWQAVADSGIRFVFVRLGYRGYNSGTLNRDDYAAANLRGARATGIKLGAYFFSQAISTAEAEEEAAYALEILDGVTLDLPLMYDWEFVSLDARTGNVDGQGLTEYTRAFCDKISAAGYDPGVYFNTDQGKKLDLQAFEAYPWWLAQYNKEQMFLCRADLWQYSNTGTVPGINGNVDLDILFTDYGLGKAVFGT